MALAYQVGAIAEARVGATRPGSCMASDGAALQAGSANGHVVVLMLLAHVVSRAA